MANLEHDPELIERMARVYAGNAAAHFKAAEQYHRPTNGPRSEWTQHGMLGASGLAIAASYWSLIDPPIAAKLYRDAMRAYRALGHDYWVVLAPLTSDVDGIALMLSAVDEFSELTPQTVAFSMIFNETYVTDGRNARRERLIGYWRHVGNLPIGRLGIPLDYYGRCAQAMHRTREQKDVRAFLFEARNFVLRVAEVLRTASHDRFHWLRLQSTVLPAEPEAVAMATAMSRMSHSMFKMPISEIPELDQHGRLLVELGDDMWRVTHENNEERQR